MNAHFVLYFLLGLLIGGAVGGFLGVILGIVGFARAIRRRAEDRGLLRELFKIVALMET